MTEQLVAVVSGGTKGIGEAVVARLLKDGYAVVTGSRSASASDSDGLTVVPVDLATAEGAQALADAALRRHGHVDALVNNVGAFTPRSSFLDVTDVQWQEGFDVNVLSAVRLTRALLPSMLQQGAGAIVTVSSVNARLPLPFVVDYSAMKAAVGNLTKALSEEFAPRGIRVNAVSPGPVKTPSWTADDGIAAGMAAQSEATRQQVLDEHVPANMAISLGRMGEPEEVASLVAFLLGGEASWITGADLVIDGGMIKTL
ncbi:oxidoreductase [Jannaschia sp. R86511]|uniref:oxidoreductase n=1 Tax=Jannaschia sp. R86511 TaxID=3093853 RepID=UPI0036D2DF1D